MSLNNIILDGHKLEWHAERVRAWIRGERIAPITIDCSLTTRCSYRCAYCYGKLQRINMDEHLSTEVIFNFLDDAAEIGVKAVSFVSDGESTCNPNLYDAIKRGYENGLDMALGTNGYLLGDDQLEEILPALTYIRFNISAGEPGRYSEIHGCKADCFYKVCNTVKKAVEIKKARGLDVTVGTQMVLLPEYKDQILPLTGLSKELGVDYFVIKHCSDDEDSTLGVDYAEYIDLTDILKEAEAQSDENFIVRAKWSKILSEGKRKYRQCYGPPFIIQLSGSGLVAPCGMFFNDKYSRYHIGNIKEKRFKDIWKSERYWEVMSFLSSPGFDANTDCGTLCLQHKVNEYLWDIKNGIIGMPECDSCKERPMHINFI
ncbi:MAG: radical SAM protein [Ruminiclostridium sp.]|nr:radical SAM protein [Ruminiclostridium sp.]